MRSRSELQLLLDNEAEYGASPERRIVASFARDALRNAGPDEEPLTWTVAAITDLRQETAALIDLILND